MSVTLTNLTGRDIEIDDGSGGRLTIPAGHSIEYPSDVASDELRQLLAGGQLKIEDERGGPAPEDDDKPEGSA